MWLEGDCHEFRKSVPRKWLKWGGSAAVAGTVTSPMPGKIIQVGLPPPTPTSSSQDPVEGATDNTSFLTLTFNPSSSSTFQHLPSRLTF